MTTRRSFISSSTTAGAAKQEMLVYLDLADKLNGECLGVIRGQLEGSARKYHETTTRANLSPSRPSQHPKDVLTVFGFDVLSSDECLHSWRYDKNNSFSVLSLESTTRAHVVDVDASRPFELYSSTHNDACTKKMHPSTVHRLQQSSRFLPG